MSMFNTTLCLAAGLMLSTAVVAQTSKDDYGRIKANADAQYKIDDRACGTLNGVDKDVCTAHAQGRRDVAKADAEAAYEGTSAARESARIAHAQASYDVAKAQCGNLAGNRNDVCVKEAEAALVKAKADAAVDRVATDTSNDQATKQAEARKDASSDIRDADYKVAIEKCNAFAGATRDSCVGDAKLQYHKS
jgi:NACalpha-BTF3-like transcription factor